MRGGLLLLPLLLGGGVVQGQRAPAPVPGEEYQISILTAGVGGEVWERWGHNMIRVRNARTGTDEVYNWGMFSFAQEGFVFHFLMGRMNYWMEPADMWRTVRLYQRRDRTLIEQQLAMTPAERQKLVTFLEWNAREENRYYRYDYYVDNCSTRLRDAIDQAMGGALKRATAGVDAGTTFRNETRRLSADALPLYTGLMLGLGPFTDTPLDRWQEMFLPMKVADRVRELRVTAPDGSLIPFVSREDTIYASHRFPEPVPAPRKTVLYLAIGALVGGLLIVAGRARGRMPFLAFGGLLALPIGFGGALLLFLMRFTDHSVTYGNENFLLVSSIALVLAAVLRPAMFGRRWAQRWVNGCAMLIAASALAAIVVKGGEYSRQDNWELVALLVPIDLGLAAGAVLAVRGRTGG